MKFDTVKLTLLALLAAAQAAPVEEGVAENQNTLDKRVKIVVNIGRAASNWWAGWLNGNNPCNLVDSDNSEKSPQYFSPKVGGNSNPCGHKFTINTGTGTSSYTWEGCGAAQTWLNHANGGFAGNCKYATKDVVCHGAFGVTVSGQYQCTVDA